MFPWSTSDSKLHNFTLLEPTLKLLEVPYDTNVVRSIFTFIFIYFFLLRKIALLFVLENDFLHIFCIVGTSFDEPEPQCNYKIDVSAVYIAWKEICMF